MGIKNQPYIHQGVEYPPLRQLSKEFGVNLKTLQNRLARGDAMERALVVGDRRGGNGHAKNQKKSKYWCVGKIIDTYSETQQLISCRRWSKP
jgi:hypothetical protein